MADRYHWRLRDGRLTLARAPRGLLLELSEDDGDGESVAVTLSPQRARELRAALDAMIPRPVWEIGQVPDLADLIEGLAAEWDRDTLCHSAAAHEAVGAVLGWWARQRREVSDG